MSVFMCFFFSFLFSCERILFGRFWWQIYCAFFLVPLVWLLFSSVLTVGTVSLLLLELYGSTLAMAMRFERVQSE